MITLITGVPGSSKTLNTINEVLNNDAYQNRPVYYYNIPEVTLKDWQELSEEDAKKWYELPHGSVVILDECQRLFRPQKYDAKVSRYIEELETHRHLGIDLFIITQHPKLIDTKVRRLVGRHLHFKRQFGMESATKIEFQKCADDPDDFFAQKEAIKSRVKFPKKLYGVYKSSEQHTHKRKVPKKLYFIGFAFLVAVYLIYSAVTSFGDSVPSPSVPQVSNVVPTDYVPPSGQGRVLERGISKEDWTSMRVPRLPDMPQSAPLYDSLTEPKSFPRPQCILRESNGVCNCYTQQATPLEISHETCVQIVASGYFDDTKPDPARGSGSGAGGSAGKGSASGDRGTASKSPHDRVMEALRIRAEIAELKAS